MFLLELRCFAFSSCIEIVEARVYNLESSLIVTMFKTNRAEVLSFSGPSEVQKLIPIIVVVQVWRGEEHAIREF
jgi:hypothetical protein